LPWVKSPFLGKIVGNDEKIISVKAILHDFAHKEKGNTLYFAGLYCKIKVSLHRLAVKRIKEAGVLQVCAFTAQTVIKVILYVQEVYL